ASAKGERWDPGAGRMPLTAAIPQPSKRQTQSVPTPSGNGESAGAQTRPAQRSHYQRSEDLPESNRVAFVVVRGERGNVPPARLGCFRAEASRLPGGNAGQAGRKAGGMNAPREPPGGEPSL